MNCCPLRSKRSDCYMNPMSKMLFLLRNDMIPDELSPIKIEALAELVEDGMAGDGQERRKKLGKWYKPVQAIVTYNVCFL